MGDKDTKDSEQGNQIQEPQVSLGNHLDTDYIERLAYSALLDVRRREIFMSIGDTVTSIPIISNEIKRNHQTVRYHIGILERAQLIKRFERPSLRDSKKTTRIKEIRMTPLGRELFKKIKEGRKW